MFQHTLYLLVKEDGRDVSKHEILAPRNVSVGPGESRFIRLAEEGPDFNLLTPSSAGYDLHFMPGGVTVGRLFDRDVPTEFALLAARAEKDGIFCRLRLPVNSRGVARFGRTEVHFCLGVPLNGV